jgi:hypothetical protein
LDEDNSTHDKEASKSAMRISFNINSNKKNLPLVSTRKTLVNEIFKETRTQIARRKLLECAIS